MSPPMPTHSGGSAVTGKLKQLPLFLPPDLERAVRVLPQHLRARAERMHLRAVDDERTWLQVIWAAVQIERATLLEVLRGDRPRRAAAARHRAWRMLAGAGASTESIADEFGMHEASVKYGIARQMDREALSAAAVAAVERYQIDGAP
jgi:hypothetical protein